MRMRAFAVSAFVLAALSVGACGSNHEDTSGIAGFRACGGLLTGSWQAVATEVDLQHSPQPAWAGASPFTDVCNHSLTAATWDAQGLGLSFAPMPSDNPDFAVYEESRLGHQSFINSLSISVECARAEFPDLDCAAIASRMLPNGEAECDVDAPPCACTSTISTDEATTSVVSARDGRYFSDFGTAQEYCRKGNTLELADRGRTGNVVTWMKLEQL